MERRRRRRKRRGPRRLVAPSSPSCLLVVLLPSLFLVRTLLHRFPEEFSSGAIVPSDWQLPHDRSRPNNTPGRTPTITATTREIQRHNTSLSNAAAAAVHPLSTDFASKPRNDTWSWTHSYLTQPQQEFYQTLLKQNFGSTNALVVLPTWLQDYFVWHYHHRREINVDNWLEYRYLVVTCFQGKRCGGVTDRLRPILELLRVANASRRILMIYWERPFALEHFLLPPVDGLVDWRVPPFMARALALRNHNDSNNTVNVNHPLLQPWVQNYKPLMRWKNIVPILSQEEPVMCTTQIQTWDYGELTYNQQPAVVEGREPDSYAVFRHVWHALFVPIPEITQRVHQTLRELQLTSGQFAAVHLRARYNPNQETDANAVKGLVDNALNCAAQMVVVDGHQQIGGPYLVLADSILAIQTALDVGRQRNWSVVATNASQHREPLHFGLRRPSLDDTPADFYDAFVDLYLLSHTRCVALGNGGYGQWGLLLGYNVTCSIRHSGHRAQTCPTVATVAAG